MIYHNYTIKIEQINNTKFKTIDEQIAEYEKTFVGTLAEHNAKRLSILNGGIDNVKTEKEYRDKAIIAVLDEFQSALQKEYGLVGLDVSHRAIMKVAIKESSNQLHTVEDRYKLLAEYVKYTMTPEYR